MSEYRHQDAGCRRRRRRGRDRRMACEAGRSRARGHGDRRRHDRQGHSGNSVACRWYRHLACRRNRRPYRGQGSAGADRDGGRSRRGQSAGISQTPMAENCRKAEIAETCSASANSRAGAGGESRLPRPPCGSSPGKAVSISGRCRRPDRPGASCARISSNS